MMNILKRFYVWLFCIAIDTDNAIELGLTFEMNVYGDGIIHLNCRSLWKYKNSFKVYRCIYLVEENPNN